MKSKNRVFKISPSILICVPFFFMIDIRAAFISGIISFSIHEFGHLIVAKTQGQKINNAMLLPFGAVFIFEKTRCTSKMKDIMLYSAGITANLLAGASAYFISQIFPSNVYFVYLTYYNILIALLNLIPVCRMDGSNILKNILEIILKEDSSSLICDISLVISVILILFNAACIISGIMIITPFALGIFGFLSTLIDKKKIRAKINVSKNGIISIQEDMNLADAIKQCGGYTNILIKVKDKEKRTVGFFNKGELLDAYNVFGHSANVRKIIDVKYEHTLQQ